MHAYRPVLALLLAALAWSFVPAQAVADEAVATVSRLRGDATLVRNNDWRALKVGDTVNEADHLLTAKGSQVELRFRDGSILVLGSDSEIVLSRYPMTGDKRAAAVGWLELLRGILRMALEPGPPESGFAVLSRAAVASVRSTEWVVEVDGQHTAVFVAHGSVGVRSIQSGGQVVLSPGEGTDVTEPGDPTPPKPWGQARVDDAMARTTIR
jgi:hypothetical protein